MPRDILDVGRDWYISTAQQLAADFLQNATKAANDRINELEQEVDGLRAALHSATQMRKLDVQCAERDAVDRWLATRGLTRQRVDAWCGMFKPVVNKNALEVD